MAAAMTDAQGHGGAPARGSARAAGRSTEREAARADMYECRTCGRYFDTWDAASDHLLLHAGHAVRWTGGR
jgi:hypothetical protein